MEYLNNTDEIRHHLQKISMQNTSLLIKMGNEPTPYGSAFIGVASGGAEGIFINMLTPQRGNALLKECKKVIISYNFGNAYFTFSSWYLEAIEEGEGYIKITAPVIISKTQERNDLRVSPPSIPPLKVDFGGGIVELVTNISISGMGFFTSQNREIFKEGKTFPDISFNLPPQKGVICTNVVVQQFIENALPDHLRVRNKCGIEFMNTRREDKNTIAQYVLERHQQLAKNAEMFYK